MEPEQVLKAHRQQGGGALTRVSDEFQLLIY